MKKYKQMRLLPSLYDIEFVVHVEILFITIEHMMSLTTCILGTPYQKPWKLFDIVRTNSYKCIEKTVNIGNKAC